MLKVSLIEFFLRSLPETIMFLFGVHIYSKIALNKASLFKSTVVIAVLVYIVRMLPISYGIHTLLAIVIIVIVAKNIHQIEIVDAIKGTIMTFIIQFISEVINMFFIETILRKNLEEIFLNPVVKTIYGLPSLILAGGIMMIYYFKCGKERVTDHEC